MKKSLCLLFALFLALTAVLNAQNGIVWSVEKNVAPSASGNNHPRMVVDRSGNPLLVWNHASRCMFSRWNGAAFTTPVLLNPAAITVAGAEWMGPDIAAHGDTVYVVFKQTPEDSDSSHIFCVHSYTGGATFSAPVRVDFIQDSLSRFPTVTTDDVGHPIVGFMKFDAFFSDSRWAVARSYDFGNTFSGDVKASGWSDKDALICDCCPGSVTCSGNTVAMLYRDNKSNNRDTWAGISTDNGNVFSRGFGIDQQNWIINACPATGPDGVILGDSLYGTFMNGASGKSLVYYSKTDISAQNGSVSVPLTGVFPGLSQQNYPRITGEGKALAIAWVQTVNGNRQCALRFTNNRSNGFPAVYDTIALNNAVNCDVALRDGKIYVVWQDANTGTMKYRSGTYTETSGTRENPLDQALSLYPNPSQGTVQVESGVMMDKVTVVNMLGQVVLAAEPKAETFSFQLRQPGVYMVLVSSGEKTAVRKVLASKDN